MTGFSLVETLVALSVGLSLAGTIMQTLTWQGQIHGRLSRLVRERAWQERTLKLIAAEVAQANRISETPQNERASCALAGRSAVLHLETGAGPITYTVGSAPSGIWRGRVLMRCGPAFDLQGNLSRGSQAQNRVVLDGLPSQPSPWARCSTLLGGRGSELGNSFRQGFSACLDQTGTLLGLRLQQELGAGSQVQWISLEKLLGKLMK